LAAAMIGAVGVLCIVLYSQSAAPSALLYGRTNNWGGFLAADNSELTIKQQRTANSLSKADLQLLKIAHREELVHKIHEKKEYKKDEADLAVIRAKKAALAVKKAAAAKDHPARRKALQAPFFHRAAKQRGADDLGTKDMNLLHIAEAEVKSENAKAVSDEDTDDKIIEASEAKKAAAAAAKAAALAQPKPAAHAARAAHAAHREATLPTIMTTPFAKRHVVSAATAPAVAPPAAIAEPAQAAAKMLHENFLPKTSKHYKQDTWGGYLPKVDKGVQRPAGHLGNKAMELLKSAQDDQHVDRTKGLKSKAFDEAALKSKMLVHRHRLSPLARKEEAQEMRENDSEASVGLRHATARDDADASQAWH